MRTACLLFTGLLMTAMPAFAQDDPMQRANDIMLKMQHDLNLSNDQVASITQIVQRYEMGVSDLEKSTSDGTANPSSTDSQKQQLKDEEEQGIAQYLRPDQLNEWRQIESQTGQEGQDAGGDDAAGGDTGADQYSNFPQNSRSP